MTLCIKCARRALCTECARRALCTECARRALYINCAFGYKCAISCTVLLNIAVCRTLVDTIRYTLECAECAFGRQMLPNAAKCCKNFFLTLREMKLVAYSP